MANPKQLGCLSLCVHYFTPENFLKALTPPVGASKETKPKPYQIYKSPLDLIFVSRTPLRPYVIEYLNLKLFNVDVLYPGIPYDTILFYNGYLEDFPDAVRAANKERSEFRLGEFFLCETFSPELFVWSHRNFQILRATDRGNETFVRHIHQHAALSRYLKLDSFYNVKVTKHKTPNLKIV